MIRHVVLVHWKEGITAEQIEAVITATRGITVPGMQHMTFGPDAKLRDGSADFAIVCDFVDEDAYRAYDTDEEHKRVSREIIFPLVDRVERCEFQL